MALPIVAQDNQEVTSELRAYRVVVDQEENEEKLVDLESVNPGDIVQYDLVYRNNMASAISNLKPELPVPGGMVYLNETASPELVGASLNREGQFEALPIVRQRTLPNGESRDITVPAEEYQRLQWLIPDLAAGEEVVISVRM